MKQKKVIWLFGYFFVFGSWGGNDKKEGLMCSHEPLFIYLSDMYLTLYASLRAPSPITTSMTIGFLPYFS